MYTYLCRNSKWFESVTVFSLSLLSNFDYLSAVFICALKTEQNKTPEFLSEFIQNPLIIKINTRDYS